MLCMHSEELYERVFGESMRVGHTLGGIGSSDIVHDYADLIMKPVGAYADQLIFMHWGA